MTICLVLYLCEVLFRYDEKDMSSFSVKKKNKRQTKVGGEKGYYK